MILGMMSNKEHRKFIQIFKGIIHSIVTVNIPNQTNFMSKALGSASSIFAISVDPNPWPTSEL